MGFYITDDLKADKLLRKIKKEREENERLNNICKLQISELEHEIAVINKKFKEEESYMESQLKHFFDTVVEPENKKETETQIKYKLFSGNLVLKKPPLKIKKDEEVLIKAYEGSEFVSNYKKFRWGDFKKTLTITEGYEVVDENGEIVEGVEVYDEAERFEVM